jgi:hypothetical protein
MKLIAYSRTYLYFKVGYRQFTILFIGETNNANQLPLDIRHIPDRMTLEDEGWTFVPLDKVEVV